MGLLGGNGAGKTTLFMALADIIVGKRCDSLKVNDRKMALSSVAFKKLRFLVFSDDRCFPTWTLDTYVRFFANSYSSVVNESVLNDLIGAFNFSQYRFISFSKLSSGNRKKVSLIAAFSLQVPALLLDEPTDFLDFSATEFYYELALLRKVQGLSTIISSHIAQTFTRCCDYVYVLEDKRLSERKSIPENPDRVVFLLHSSVSQFR